MKKVFLSGAFLVLFVMSAFTQQVSGQPFRFNAFINSFSVTPDGHLAAGTTLGEIGFANAIDQPWHFVHDSHSRRTTGRQHFFNKDTGFINGFFTDSINYSAIRHTCNAGRTWQTIRLATAESTETSYHLDNGEAWVCTRRDTIYYTKDYGFTWHPLAFPGNTQRLSSLFFTERGEGIAAADNALFYTPDNCKTWQLLPTPFNQHKYNKTDTHHGLGIYETAIYNNYLLVAQEELIFYSRRDSINWILLPQYISFTANSSGTDLFFLTHHYQPVAVNRELKPLYIYPEHKAYGATFIRNGSLFALSTNQITQYKPDRTSLQTPLLIDTLESPRTANMLRRLAKDSISYKTKHVLPGLLQTYGKNGLSFFVCQATASGCFYYDFTELRYQQEGNKFKLARKNRTKQDERLLPLKSTQTDTADAAGFIREILAQSGYRLNINDLAFSKQDYRQCKKDILAFRDYVVSGNTHPKSPRFILSSNNIDFIQLLAAVDSIKYADENTIEQAYMQARRSMSTSETLRSLSFTDTEGHVLSIESKEYDVSDNKNWTRWNLTIDNIPFITNPAIIIPFIKRHYPSMLIKGDKMRILHALAATIYKNQQANQFQKDIEKQFL